MKFRSVVYSTLCFLSTILPSITASDGNELYSEAVSILEGFPSKYSVGRPIYTNDNIDNNLYIPQYDTDAQDYEYPSNYQNVSYPIVYDTVLPMLEQAAELGNPKALITLADIYIFGNYSVKTNYSKSLEYYHKAVSIEASGHAYFMLGFIYSTGLFGEVPVDQVKATLYYQFGMENGNANAILALAFRSFYGIDTPTNCELSSHYYSRLSHLGMDLLNEHEEENEEDDLFYNIRLIDFNGGIYGHKVSETPTSIFSNSKSYSTSKDLFNEYNLDIDDHDYVEYYFDALENYDGDYFIQKNRSKAFELAKECVELGENMYGFSDYRSVNQIDQVFLSRCQALLGHMYLKGHGTDKDYEKAYHWLYTSTKVSNTSEALNDIGLIYEKGLLPTKEPNITTAIEYYKEAITTRGGSQEASVNLAKLLIKVSDNEDPFSSPFRNQIFGYIQQAVYGGNTEAFYYLGDFLQCGLGSTVHPDKQYSCEHTIVYHKIFVERLEKFFLPHLKYAFDELRFGNFKNALIGYSIAAEQGLENAQVSASYLLYQLQPFISKYKKKTFNEERVKSAIKYLERSSSQNNIDSTILLGDIYLFGIEASNISIDYNKAFTYFNRAALQQSSHGCYNLAYMYEYGLGPVNNTVDYFMAKRYYDLSLKYREMEEKRNNRILNKIPINLALLRLRLKYLFNKKKFKNQDNNAEATGWLNAFRKIGNNDISNKNDNAQDNKLNSKAQAHHEGSSYFVDEEYDAGDYLVIFLTFMFFLIFFIQNVIRQFRRMRNNNQGNQQNEERDRNQQQVPQNGWNGNQFNFRRGNFEFHFFAI